VTAELGAAFNFTDLGGLAALRREAAQDTPEARRVVAQQFESLFLGLMLGTMRGAAEIDGGLVDNERLRLSQDMHDRQLALTLSQGGGIGLADSILRQLGDAPPAAFRPQVDFPRAAPFYRSGLAPEAAPARLPAGHAGGTSGGMSGEDARRDIARLGAAQRSAGIDATGRDASTSREQFIAATWPHARRAAAKLGVPAEVLVAQAALETGWGKHTIRDASGRSTFNVFGIKTGSGWSGRRVTVPTLEFVDGVPERRRDAFRAYGSVADSFDDYVVLVSGQPRYRAALEATDARRYMRALQDGGYSTDPRYADKIMAIVDQGLIRREVARQGLPDPRAQAAAAGADTNVTGLASDRGRAAGGDES
jgi:peptidoglycan hydrolase FlgJ